MAELADLPAGRQARKIQDDAQCGLSMPLKVSRTITFTLG
jgi:hypothetical protein